MPGSRWVITSSWLSRSFKSFLCCFSVYFCQFFLIILKSSYNYLPTVGVMFLFRITTEKRILLFFCDPTDVGNLISGSSAFSKSCLYIWKFSVHVLLKPSLKDFEHYFASKWNHHICRVVWTFFGIALWDLNENWPFTGLWPLLSFPNLLAKWAQHFKSIIF